MTFIAKIIAQSLTEVAANLCRVYT